MFHLCIHKREEYVVQIPKGCFRIHIRMMMLMIFIPFLQHKYFGCILLHSFSLNFKNVFFLLFFFSWGKYFCMKTDGRPFFLLIQKRGRSTSTWSIFSLLLFKKLMLRFSTCAASSRCLERIDWRNKIIRQMEWKEREKIHIRGPVRRPLGSSSCSFEQETSRWAWWSWRESFCSDAFPLVDSSLSLVLYRLLWKVLLNG